MRTVVLSLRILFLGILLISIPSFAFAKTKSANPSQIQQYEQRLEELEQKTRVLERNLELKEEAEKEKAKEKPVIKASTSGISISSADGNNEIRFRGLIQADTRFYLDRDGQGAVNTFLLRRVRPYIEGKFAKRWEFRIMPDFGEGKVQLIDAYIDTVVFANQFKIRVGKTKEPVGLERLQSASNLVFPERGLPTNLVPNRDLGIMLHGDIAEGLLTYQIGVFNGVPDAASADFALNNSKEFAGRVFAHPFKKTSAEAAKGLGLGVSGTFGNAVGDEDDPQLPSYKSGGQQTIFRYRSDGTPEGTAIADGTRWRISPQAYYYYKGFGLLGEYALSSQRVTLDTNSDNILNKAWQVQASYVIGADNTYGTIKPRKPLGWKKSGTGAFQFAARYNELIIDQSAFPIFADPDKSVRKAKAWAVGFNWIINENAKLMTSFEQTHFDGGGAGGSDRKTENALINRYQLNF